MDSVPPPLSLIEVVHYHQEAGKNPRPFIVAPYREWVEVVTAGRGWVRDGEGWRELLPGDIVWQSPGDESIGRSDFENPFHTLAVMFEVRRAKGMGVRRFSNWPDVEEVNLVANETSRLVWEEAFDRNVLKDYLFSKLIYQVRLYERSLQMDRYPGPVATVMTRIENDFSKPLRMEQLARESGWSVTHLHAEFQKHVHISPHQMLIQKRLRVAKKNLVSTGEPVKGIAAECGFSTVAAFAHAFKAHTGQTPSEYRRSHFQHR